MNNSNNFHSDKAGNWIGVGVAIGAVIYVLTNEAVWIALGVAVGSALAFSLQKIK